MADLSVIDVQKALREHGALGHDLTQHRGEVHVKGKPYRMRVGATLHWAGPEEHSLLSTLTQSERPLLTSVASHKFNPKDYEHEGPPVSPPTLKVGVKIPFQELYEGNLDEVDHSFIHTGDLADHDDEGMNYSEDHGIPRNRSYAKETADVHEALKSHVTKNTPYVGFEYTHQHDIRNPKHRYVTSLKDFTEPFKLHRSLEGLHVVKPYSGLIRVTHRNSWNSYLYDPDTEQLIGSPLGEYKFGEDK